MAGVVLPMAAVSTPSAHSAQGERLASDWKAIVDDATTNASEPIFEFRDTDRIYRISATGFVEMRKMPPEEHARCLDSKEAVAIYANRIGGTVAWAVMQAQIRTRKIIAGGGV